MIDNQADLDLVNKRIGDEYGGDVREYLRNEPGAFFPARPDYLLKVYGLERAVKDLEEVIHQKNGSKQMFGRLCGLLKFEELSENLKEWFVNKKIVINESLGIEPFLSPFGEENVCHEQGMSIIDGAPIRTGYKYDTWGPPYINTNCVNKVGDILAEVSTPWGEDRYKFVSFLNFFHNPKYRGIIVPGDLDGIYIKDRYPINEEDLRTGVTGFSLMSFNGLSREFIWAMRGVNDYLKGNIGDKSQYKGPSIHLLGYER